MVDDTVTLIVTRTSCRYALMVTDRRATRNGAVVDPDSNKNIVFCDRNAVVAIGYTGMAYIGAIPADQWIAQTLTGLTFPEGRRGRGTVPVLMTNSFEDRYLGIRVRNLRDRLNEVRPLIHEKHRGNGAQAPLIFPLPDGSGTTARPYVESLSKLPNSLVRPARSTLPGSHVRCPILGVSAGSQTG